MYTLHTHLPVHVHVHVHLHVDVHVVHSHVDVDVDAQAYLLCGSCSIHRIWRLNCARAVAKMDVNVQPP